MADIRQPFETVLNQEINELRDMYFHFGSGVLLSEARMTTVATRIPPDIATPRSSQTNQSLSTDFCDSPSAPSSCCFDVAEIGEPLKVGVSAFRSGL
jgi:hypothetical protein